MIIRLGHIMGFRSFGSGGYFFRQAWSFMAKYMLILWTGFY
jgi:hypothetical protein